MALRLGSLHSRSCEDAVKEPAGGAVRAGAFAKHPVAPAAIVLDAEIVAFRDSIGAPPFGRDALGPFDAPDPVMGTPPAELTDRAIGHFGRRIHRLGRHEKA